MHQDLGMLPVREERAPDARAPGEQRAGQRDEERRPNHHCEVRLLPPRPGRGRRVARALHHAGRPVIGGRSPGLLRRPHRGGGTASSFRCACLQIRTRGYAAEIQKRRGR